MMPQFLMIAATIVRWIAVWNADTFRASIVEDGSNMDVPNLVVVLGRFGSDFTTPDKDVLESSIGVFASDGVGNRSKIFVRLHVDSGVPLSVFVLVADILRVHGKMKSELWIMVIVLF